MFCHRRTHWPLLQGRRPPWLPSSPSFSVRSTATLAPFAAGAAALLCHGLQGRRVCLRLPAKMPPTGPAGDATDMPPNGPTDDDLRNERHLCLSQHELLLMHARNERQL